jgi:predicted signal transduction protein with EAL and GGDEF domain
MVRRLTRYAENHAAGDATLGAAGQRGDSSAARLEVDRFGLLLRGMADGEAIEAAARDLIAEFVKPVALGEHEVAPGVWVGVGLFGTDGSDAQTLRRSAERAGSHARQTGAGPLAFASKELNARTLERMTLGSQLRGAVERGELRLHYQPKVDLADGRVVGAEALVRWQHPQHGLQPPGRFIALAEELGLITDIGNGVAEQACRDAASWAAAGHPLKVGHQRLEATVPVRRPVQRSALRPL